VISIVRKTRGSTEATSDVFSDHQSAAFAELQTKWGLVDALEQPTDRDRAHIAAFQVSTHTYRYSLLDGEPASARLDRWYTSADLVGDVAKVDVGHPGARGDHQAVRLHLIDPRDPIRIRKPARVYPPPDLAMTQVRDAMAGRLGELTDAVHNGDLDAAALAAVWEDTKTAIRIESLRLIKQRRKMARATYKQKCRRLMRQERRILEEAAGCVHTVETITDLLDAMSLKEGRGDTPLKRVRAAITDCLRGRLALRQRFLFQKNGYRPGITTKRFFGRLSTKYGDNVIHRLDAATDHPERGAHGQPDTMADAWASIFQQQPASDAARLEVVKWLGEPGQYPAQLADIMDPFTEEEVAAAIRASKPGKACGPDRLGNDWYRDFASLLVPVLTIMFNKWYPNATFPESFLEADIFCLKKGGAATDPLNFRQLSLMNTDYKLVTRILATRSSKKLPAIIHPNQNGFVPLIHATLDLFAAAQVEANRNPEFAEALALLLDFCKAYDSVDREFMYAVLLWLGFPSAFVAVMRAMHDGTRVRFLANGYRSGWVTVTCGIRQGCPLAPLLFILVLEALYRRLDNHPRIAGITLRSRAGCMQLRVGRYADDTASYVKTPQEVPIVLEVTRVFALASGLKLNEGKTLVIALNPNLVGVGILLPKPLKLQAEAHLSRYLGLPVGSRPDAEHTWDLAHSQLTTRLALAMQKTTTVDQRSLVVAAIVIPKLLYIGRHHWPSAATVAAFQRRIHNFVWHAQFTGARVSGRAWMNDHVAALPREQGGLGLPLLKTELLAMAAVVVANWAVLSTPEQLIVGDVLAAPDQEPESRLCVVAPRFIPAQRPDHRIGTSVWEAGVRINGLYGGMEMHKDKAAMVAGINCLNYFAERRELLWSGRQMIVELDSLVGSLSDKCVTAEAKQRGVFCGEWLPYLSLRDMRLYAPDGQVVNPNTQYRTLCQEGVLLKDVVHWTWSTRGNLKVTALTSTVTRSIRRQIEHLMQTMVLNFPQLLRGGSHDGRIRYFVAAPDHIPIWRTLAADGDKGRPGRPQDALTQGVNAVHAPGSGGTANGTACSSASSAR
jgi:hypothetical protein